jgi:hypothetical protein
VVVPSWCIGLRFSAITLSYDAADIADAVGSVVAQTHCDLQHIVTDDDTTGGTTAMADVSLIPYVALLREPYIGRSLRAIERRLKRKHINTAEPLQIWRGHATCGGLAVFLR